MLIARAILNKIKQEKQTMSRYVNKYPDGSYQAPRKTTKAPTIARTPKTGVPLNKARVFNTRAAASRSAIIECEQVVVTLAEGVESPAVCPTCEGCGTVRVPVGFFCVQQECPDCGGEGVVC